MSWTLDWTGRALRDADRLDRQARERVISALDRFAETEAGDVLRLHGVHPPQWRIRVGEWRVRISLDRATNTARILRVLPRGRAYRR